MMKKLTKMVLLSTALMAFFSTSAVAKITVFAAASMTNALEEVAKKYKQVNPDEEIAFSFASSSVLARQITEGAPADIFISADQKWMTFLKEKNAVEESSVTNLVGNKLVMIAPTQSNIDSVDLTNSKWHSALQNSYLSVGDPDHVPAGIYAKTAFTYLKQWDALENKLARGKNVRAALRLVELGESPLGVVYATDAAVTDKVKTVAIFPAESHPPVEYPLAIVKYKENKANRDFYNFLQSEEAKGIYQKFGFSTF